MSLTNALKNRIKRNNNDSSEVKYLLKAFLHMINAYLENVSSGSKKGSSGSKTFGTMG